MFVDNRNFASSDSYMLVSLCLSHFVQVREITLIANSPSMKISRRRINLDRPQSGFAKDATYCLVELVTCSYCFLNLVQIQCWPYEISGLIFQSARYCFPPKFELRMTGSMQHIQFEGEEKVIAANGNAALSDLNCGGKLMTLTNFDTSDMTRPTYKIPKID